MDRYLFEAARSIILARSHKYSDEEMLDGLRQILERNGFISGIVINEAEELPSSTAYQHRFGSLLRAYQLVGFTPDRDYSYIEENRALRAMHPSVIADTIAGIQDAGGQVHRDPINDLLTINGEFTASLVIVRCKPTDAGAARWHVRLDTGLLPDITVAVRMDRQNDRALDYYLLPRIDISAPRIRMAEQNGIALDAYRFDSLSPLFGLAARASIQEAA